MNAVMRRVRRNAEGGFSLIELLVVVLILGIVGAIVGSGMIGALRADRRTRARVATTADLTKGVDRMTKQIRVAAPVIAFTPTSLTVQTYRDGFRWQYTYTHDSATKSVVETTNRYTSETAVVPDQSTTRTLLTNITNDAGSPMFAYYDRDGAVPDEVDEVARVVVTLVETPLEQGPIRFETSVFLRNYRET